MLPVTASRQGHDLGILLGLAYQQFVQELRAGLSAVGVDALGRSDGYVFRALDERASTVSELAERLQITKQGAAQIVADMERRGLVEGHPHPGDGRARLIRLTDEGNRALREARQFHRAFERRLVRELGPGPVDGLVATLEHVVGDETLRDPRIRALYL
jgi:DNA-binding MarR family transcriptional regulator